MLELKVLDYCYKEILLQTKHPRPDDDLTDRNMYLVIILNSLTVLCGIAKNIYVDVF
jgi:hypothetical protein